MRVKTKCRMGDLCAIRKGNDECEKNCYYNQREVKTNYDIIHSMNAEGLAELFSGLIQDCDCNSVPCKDLCKKDRDSDEVKPCTYYWLEWLRQESKNEA